MEINVLILLLNVISTWFMVGLIWFVQIVHYPLFNRVEQERFVEYQDRHQKLTTWVVGPPMLVEAVTSMLLVWFPPPVNGALLLLGIGLLLIIWVSTALLQVPCHSELNRGFNPKFHQQLVVTNWLRTVCWSLRGVLVTWFVLQTINHPVG